jgi:hypothetical protein
MTVVFTVMAILIPKERAETFRQMSCQTTAKLNGIGIRPFSPYPGSLASQCVQEFERRCTKFRTAKSAR